MADTQITNLTTGTSLSSGDYLEYVDVSDSTMAASGTNKKISANDLFKTKGHVVVSANDSPFQIGADYLCDGTADEVQIQSAIDAVSSNGGGEVVLLSGTYNISSKIVIKHMVRLRGEGWGTVLKGVANGGDFSIIDWDNVTYTSGNPITDVEILDLKIDGSIMTQTSFTSAKKGINAWYCVRWRIKNVWIYKTLATGIGTDHMKDSVIDGNFIDQCGRGVSDPNTDYGGNGIGIGIGDLTDESVIVCNNTVRGIGNNGIMVEVQHASHTFGDYLICNNHIDGCARAVRVSGVQNVRIIGNTLRDSSKQNLYLSDAPPFSSASPVTSSNIKIIGNTIKGATLDGICLPTTDSGNENDAVNYTDILIEGNLITGNGSDGIQVGAKSATTTSRVRIRGNEITTNTAYGINLNGTLDEIDIEGNYLQGNTSGAVTNTATLTNAQIRANRGYNPLGPATITVTTSPFTYTAGPTPEVVYITGGTVTDISKSSTTLFTDTNHSVVLEPNEAVVVTYSSIPIMMKDRL